MPRARRSKSRRSTRRRRASARRRDRLLFADDARRPWPSLLFLAPLLVFYTAGLAWVRPDLASAADLLLRRALAALGVSGVTAPALVVVVVLVVWHLVEGDPWRVRPGLVAAMLAETLLLAVPLLALHAAFRIPGMLGAGTLAVGGGPAPGGEWLAAVMTSIGTGLYEELIFRLALVGGLLLFSRRVLRLKGNGAIVAGVLIFAALFAGAHSLYRPAEFAWPAFLFRTAAGVYLSYVFAVRGFGIAVGVHVVHNLLVEVVGGA